MGEAETVLFYGEAWITRNTLLYLLHLDEDCTEANCFVSMNGRIKTANNGPHALFDGEVL